MTEQLALGLVLRDSARFSNFVAGVNSELVEQLQKLARSPGGGQLLCWGVAGAGKSHLLQACCHEATAAGHTAAYLSLEEAAQLPPQVIDGWEQFSLVCLDDIEVIAGRADWEEAVFHLYNRMHACAGGLLVATRAAPSALPFDLPDLVSRLGAGLVYQLRAADEEYSLQALQLRAGQRGFELPDDTARYLLKRMPRDLPALMSLLERLDSASLVAQRRLTVPFVKSVLSL